MKAAASANGMEMARRGAAYLYREGAAKVWVFGSVAKGRRLDFRSDVDFAVEGFPSEKVLRAGAALERLLDFPVDLVELEGASSGLRAQVLDYGILLPRED